jgi:histidinol dehydrogenase
MTNNNFDNMDEKIEETVQEMKAKIDEITRKSEEINDNDLAAKANQIKDRAINVLNDVTKKLSTTANDLKESDDFKKVLEFVKTKSKELSDATLKKINELKEDQRIKEGFDNTFNFVKEKSNKLTEGIKENEKVKGVIDDVSEKGSKLIDSVKVSVDDLLNKTELDEKIVEVKNKTVDIAEKAVQALKEWLKPEVYKQEEIVKEEVKEEIKENSEE